MRPSLLLAVVVAAVACATPAQAWWCNGHMLTVSTAMQYVSSTTFSRVSDLIKVLAPYYKQSPDVVTSACWADDLKSEEEREEEDWHYINLAYVNGPMYSDVYGPTYKYNVLWAINNARSMLSNNVTSELDKARQLRFMLHFEGDLHQPLHLLTYYSQAFPHGDGGGNTYFIKGANQSILHEFYDSGAGQWQTAYPRPLQSNTTAWLDEWVQDITAEFPKSQFDKELAMAEPKDWADAIFANYASLVYSVKNGSTVSNDYINQARQLCRRQIALGGYRLAQDLDKYVFPK